MRYFIRSVKCLVLVAILFTIVVLAMFYLSEHDSSLRPWDLFCGNWKKIILFFVAYAAVYPLIGYSKRDVPFGEGFSARRQEIANLLRQMNLVPSSPENGTVAPNVLKLHNNSGFVRVLRLFEDTVTLTENEGIVTVEGQRKDVVRVSMRLEDYLRKRAENQEQQ